MEGSRRRQRCDVHNGRPDAAMTNLLSELLDSERRLTRCYEKALECTCDPVETASWRTGLDRTGRRVAVLAHLLGNNGATKENGESKDPTDCLVEAMELALSNGDRRAAQIVARECMALAESRRAALCEDIAATARSFSYVVPVIDEALGHGFGRLSGSR